MTKISDEQLTKMLAEFDRYDFGYDTMENADDGYYVRYDQVEELLTTLRAHNSDSAEPVAFTTPTIIEHLKDPKSIVGSIWPKHVTDACEPNYATVPLYLASPTAKEVEITDDVVEQRVELITNALLHLPLPGKEIQFAARQVELALRQALTNRTPDDEVGNGND